VDNILQLMFDNILPSFAEMGASNLAIKVFFIARLEYRQTSKKLLSPDWKFPFQRYLVVYYYTLIVVYYLLVRCRLTLLSSKSKKISLNFKFFYRQFGSAHFSDTW